jgi:hypothetical protein
MRVAAILFVLAGAAGVYLASQYQLTPDGVVALVPGAALAGGIVGLVFALIYALVLWGFADGLILLADVDDAQRATQRQLSDLTLAQRTARGPFHSEVVAGSRPPEGG